MLHCALDLARRRAVPASIQASGAIVAAARVAAAAERRRRCADGSLRDEYRSSLGGRNGQGEQASDGRVLALSVEYA